MLNLRAASWMLIPALLVGGVLLANSADEVQPHAGMLRYPDISASDIVFVYANDLWLVPREGGLARPLASPPGAERFPRFSPDGSTIAFMGNYDGVRDLYTIPVTGGIPTRVTYHPFGETLNDWTPDGKLLFSTGAFSGRGFSQLFTVDAEGGLYEQVSVPWGGVGAISPDGEWLAYTPHDRDSRTWKRYRGGMATDIWLFNLKTKESKQITDWEGTDTRPMWHGKTVYYLSDAADSHRLNIFAYDTDSGRTTQVTDFSDYDVKWPSVGPGANGQGEIIFQLADQLMAVDLDSGANRSIPVTIPGDRPEIRPKAVEAEEYVLDQAISPTGKRALFGARGDIWTVPAKEGSPRNLTRTPGSAERHPEWSPDGRWIAYFSDAQGEYDLYLREASLRSEPEKVTDLGPGYRRNITWAPDSKKLTFNNEKAQLLLFDVESREVSVIDQDPFGGTPRVGSWSHDSNWFAYSRSADSTQNAIFLYDVDGGASHQVTAGFFSDSWPTFDRKGDYLYFASNRDVSRPIYEDLGGTTWVYTQTDRLFMVPLRADMESPLAPKSDEESWEAPEQDEGDDSQEGEEEKSEGAASEEAEAQEGQDESAQADESMEGEGKEGKDEEKEPLKIDLEGFEQRAVMLPVERGSFFLLNVNDKGQLLYARNPVNLPGNRPSIQLFDVNDEEKGEQTVLEGAGGYAMSADGKAILVQQGPRRAILKAAPKQQIKDALKMDAMNATVDPRVEWRQIFMDAWRFQRDFFYAENMHGVDWPRVRRQYEAMLEDCVTRSDVDFVIDEMISELNVGHAYNFGGDLEDEPRRNVGMLGVDFELADGAYRIARIIEGAPWDVDARGPLSRPGVDVEEGDYILAVNGLELDTSKDPYAAFQGLANQTVTLTVSDTPEWDDSRELVVTLLSNENSLRYRDWVERNRKYVEEKSGGKLGYIYVPDTGQRGQSELVRQFIGQIRKQGLVIDERWNGGGQIPTRFVELLNRPVTNFWAIRHGQPFVWPPDAHHGPKAMLINGLAGSGGDAFPAYFKQAGLGPLIGTRTWGGLVGISGGPRFVDGGAMTSPSFAYFDKDGTWGIEGHGVDPDIEVVADPSEMQDGSDPQIDAAIEYLLAEIERNPFVWLDPPSLPDRSGMGLPEEDK
ncbi:MAG TPA: PDZ domain-containing protein [Acidobacteriota bacterium]|nr:PDZ domain-containing protein [Acidobacteriota bacterium]